ncbi:hypothetical protein DB346_02180 [Verrucomicrobia bacterium LW23]|nr:hypothetical protein DB346_02180 [Verrucomicrobia bacterium LW23]
MRTPVTILAFSALAVAAPLPAATAADKTAPQPAAAAAATKAETAEATLPAADVWLRQLIAPCFSGDGSGSIAAHDRIEKEFISEELRRLLAADAADSKRTGEVARMDFDWIVNSQENPDKWVVAKPQQEGKLTIVPIKTGYGHEKMRTHYIVLEKGPKSWIIVDARYDDTTLLKILTAPLP